MLRYDVVDVFTDRPFAGNQLAVVHGAEALTTEQCQAIAQEFGYSETTFPAAPADGGREYAVRIFTPGAEIPFAGHPTLGTAWVLRRLGLLTGPVVTQVCGAGRIGVRFVDDPADDPAGDPAEGAAVELSATRRDLVGPLDEALAADLLADLGLSAADLAGPAWVAGCGLSFVHLPVRADAVARAVPSSRPLAEYADRLRAAGAAHDPVEGIDLFHASGSGAELDVHARVFVPGLAVPEDPATGSSAAGLGLALVAAGRLPAGGRYTITQGVEMGRPSRLFGRVEADGDGQPTLSHVAGQVQPVASGEIAVPPAV